MPIEQIRAQRWIRDLDLLTHSSLGINMYGLSNTTLDKLVFQGH